MEGFELDIANSIDAGWPKWRQVRGVLCDHSLILQLNGHYRKIISRLALLYGAECWGWWNEELIYTCWNAQAKMSCDFTGKDRIRDEHSRGNLWIEGGKLKRNIVWDGLGMYIEGRQCVEGALVPSIWRRGRVRNLGWYCEKKTC